MNKNEYFMFVCRKERDGVFQHDVNALSTGTKMKNRTVSATKRSKRRKRQN